jgi:hypothetical protein
MDSRLLLLLLLLLLPAFLVGLSGQNRMELGLFLGGSYYQGDLNPSVPFKETHPAFGGLLRYNMTDRIAWKATATLGRLSGSYPSPGVRFPNAENMSYSFERNIADCSAQMELNFMSYDHPYISGSKFTPYISYGVATTIYKRYGNQNQNEKNKTVFVLSLPFGIGAKYKINNWIRVGAEWTFRKTFVDDLDVTGQTDVINPDDPYWFDDKTFTHNNDWYSFAGVTVSFSFLRKKTSCSAGY